MFLKSSVVYKFTCAGCGSRYVGETSRHLSTRIKEHLGSDKNSYIFKHLSKLILTVKVMFPQRPNCFKIIDSDKSYIKLYNLD